jgi:hypothetical protein
VYNLQNPVGSRVVSAEARCLSCDIPKYYPLRDSEDYNIFGSTFIINGGDGYNFEALKRHRFSEYMYIMSKSCDTLSLHV